MYTKLPRHGVKAINWPEGLPFPLHLDVKDPDTKLHQSIHTLSAMDLNMLASTVRHPDYPFHFEIYDGDPIGKLYLYELFCHISQ